MDRKALRVPGGDDLIVIVAQRNLASTVDRKKDTYFIFAKSFEVYFNLYFDEICENLVSWKQKLNFISGKYTAAIFKKNLISNYFTKKQPQKIFLVGTKLAPRSHGNMFNCPNSSERNRVDRKRSQCLRSICDLWKRSISSNHWIRSISVNQVNRSIFILNHGVRSLPFCLLLGMYEILIIIH